MTSRMTTVAVGAYVTWVAAAAITWFRVTGSLDERWAVVVIFLIGVAVSLSVKLSRLRLTAAITAVFQAGLLASDALRKEEEDARNSRPSMDSSSE